MPQAYTIQKGDTLSQIAQTNNTSVSALLSANPTIKNPDLIYAGSSLNLPGSTPPTSPTVLSTVQGANSVQKDAQTLGKLQGAPPTTPATTDQANLDALRKSLGDPNAQLVKPATMGGSTTTTPAVPTVTYINPATGQSQKLNTDSLSPDTVANLQAQGYHVAESEGNVPAWITTGNPEAGKAQADLTKATNDLNDLKAGLSKFTMSDADLSSQIQGITAQWDARIADMSRINAQRQGAVTTLGIRTGDRYTGGTGGMFGGIIAEEERQGVQRIADLEGQKQTAIAAAKEAARTKNWQVYSQQVAAAEKSYTEKLQAVSELNKTVAANNQKVQDAAKTASRQGAILDLIDQGVTDPAKLAQYLNYDDKGNLIGDVSLAEINDVLKTAGPKIENYISDAIGSGLTDPVQIYNSLKEQGKQVSLGQIADMIKSLHSTEQQQPGIVGEWLAAKKNDPSLAGTSLIDYIKAKDPSLALDMQLKKAQIAKIQKDLQDVGSNMDPANALAYINEYASTGKIPTGIPKGSFGVIAAGAKELPKEAGTIVDRNTGVHSSSINSTLETAYSGLYSTIDLAKQLKELDTQRTHGILGGIGQFIGGLLNNKIDQQYTDLQTQISDLLARSRTGAAINASEERLYNGMLPGLVSNPLGTGPDSQQKLDNFIKIITSDLENKTKTQGLAIYGLSKVKVGDQTYTVGDVIQNDKGQSGRVNPDGSITIVE
jgi:LysM repeat protein